MLIKKTRIHISVSFEVDNSPKASSDHPGSSIGRGTDQARAPLAAWQVWHVHRKIPTGQAEADGGDPRRACFTPLRARYLIPG
jgi:hypothetical protein